MEPPPLRSGDLRPIPASRALSSARYWPWLAGRLISRPLGVFRYHQVRESRTEAPMEYVISRPYPLPTTTAELNGALFFNMWGRRYWPYGALEIGDLLIWYYSPGKAIV